MASSEPIELDGEHVRLRSTVADDVPALVAIRATPEVHARWGGDDLERELIDELDEDGLVQLTIEAAGRVVGLIQFAEENDPQYRHASIDIYIDPAVHRRGHASDAIRTLSDHLFDERRHHRLTIDPTADNQAAIACYASVGFRAVGILRSYERRPDGTWSDGLLMERLASDEPVSSRREGASPEQLELELLQPDTRGDAGALERLLHEDFTEVGASGRAWTRSELIADLESSPDTGPIDVTDLRTQMFGDDVALVTYRTITTDRMVLRTSLWRRGDGGWRIRHHQGTVVGASASPESVVSSGEEGAR